MRDGLLLVYCAAVGFVAGGVATSFYKWMTSEAARFALLGTSVPAYVLTFLFFALTGPVLVVEQTIRSRLESRVGTGWIAAGIVTATAWSCCSGLLVLELVLSLRDSLA